MDSKITSDTIEIIESDDVPLGKHRCPYCSQIFDYDPIALSPMPNSPAMCFDCLPEDIKKKFDDNN